MKNGGTNVVSNAEPYALAWAFVSPTLSIINSGSNVFLSWPVYPAGFAVVSATNLISPIWSTNNFSPAIITNNMNSLLVSATNAAQFFRLQSPNF